MAAGGEPAGERRRRVAARPEEAGRVGFRAHGGHEIQARHFQTPTDVVRVSEHRVRLEAPEQEVDEYYRLEHELRQVVRPIVEADWAYGQANGRERDHSHNGHVEHVMAAELGAFRVDDVVQASAFRHDRAHDVVSVFRARVQHFTRLYTYII